MDKIYTHEPLQRDEVQGPEPTAEKAEVLYHLNKFETIFRTKNITTKMNLTTSE